MHPQGDGSHGCGPFRFNQCADLAPLRRVLEEAGYVESALAKTVTLDTVTGRPSEISVVLRRTAEVSPYNSLIRLFLLAHAVPEETARAALVPVDLEQLLAVGLLRRGEEGIRAQAALLPFEGLLLARDFWPDFVGKPSPQDYVPGVAPASLAVANLTVRRPIRSALDLGAGLGFQACLAARHADHVIATDTNPRALNFAKFNARLNGLSNIELRQGSLYEPVADRRFDLIVSNPPFVISPRLEYQYRDGGMAGDMLSEQVVRGAPALLQEGGFATVLFNWHHRTEDDWPARPTEWLASSGCDAWLLCSDTKDPLAYASGWLSHEHGRDRDRYSRLLDEWLSYYERLGIGFISFGAVILRRRPAGPNWLRAERAPEGQANASCSDQIQRIFTAQDLLERLGEAKNLLDKAFVLTADHQLEHVLKAENGNWAVKSAQLKQIRGFPFVGNVDRLVSTVLAGCDGRRTVGELVADLAAGLGMDAERIAPACIDLVRKLLETGFLIEANTGGTGN
jgi:methylase of polypeptide subunit release factors